MGFNRNNGSAKATFRYICSQDTALSDAFNPSVALAVFDEMRAINAYVEKQLPKGDDSTKEVARSLVLGDSTLKNTVIERAQISAVLDLFFASYPGETTKSIPHRADFETLDLLADVIKQCESAARRVRHAKYREFGDESTLGVIGSDVLRWHVRILPPPLRAEAKGMIADSDPGVSSYQHIYNVNRWIVEHSLMRVDNWPDADVGKFEVTKQGFVTPETLDKIDDEWILELGDFVLDLPNLRQSEKKA